MEGISEIGRALGNYFANNMFAPPANRSASPVTAGADRFDISPQTLDSLRVQAGVLRNELPGIIADSLLRPVASDTVPVEPITAVFSRFIAPARAIFGSGTPFSGEDLQGFQTEVRQMSRDLPRLLADDLLSGLAQDSVKSDALHGILRQISGQLESLADLVSEHIPGA